MGDTGEYSKQPYGRPIHTASPLLQPKQKAQSVNMIIPLIRLHREIRREFLWLVCDRINEILIKYCYK